MSDIKSVCGADCASSAAVLNHDCFCTTLNPKKLNRVLSADHINQDILKTQPQLFSNTTVFISPTQLQKMRNIVRALVRVTGLQIYQKDVLATARNIASFNPGTSGVFMGYDFHLNETGPHIIEVNTNAGGAFLNAALVSAQTECCRAEGSLLPTQKQQLDETFVNMFVSEWRLQRGDKPLTRIAIVDENPAQQFLYAEFKMAQRLFEEHKIDAVIVDPSELTVVDGSLFNQGKRVDLVYNRLTDFSLESESLAALRSAYEVGTVVLTPNPRQYALYANKRNLALLSDHGYLEKIGADKSDIELLSAAIPKTQIVTRDNAESLWANRKHLFFKPTSGYGSKAAYRGDKITKRVWEDILQADYVAQQIVQPSERGILVDQVKTALKMDIRAYVYGDEIQLLAARLYQGQTTNFRTQGGGFAPVFIVGDAAPKDFSSPQQ